MLVLQGIVKKKKEEDRKKSENLFAEELLQAGNL